MKTAPQKPSPAQIRQALDDTTQRPRDLAASLGVSEADLLAARVDGDRVVRISADPDALLPGVETLGEVMALTRNDSIVSEVEGTFGGYRPGEHAGLVLGQGIDLRIFRRHWVHGFAVVAETKAGIRLSFQVFDAAGDAVHKIYLPKGAEASGWEALREALRIEDQSDSLVTDARAPVEAAILRPEVAAALRADWAEMGDTHKFPALMRKHGINRLGAYRVVGAPWARPLAVASVGRILDRLAETGTPSMIFVGNAGCVQIFSGQIGPIKTMGPWLNVLDPGFDMHLRGDHIAEVWAIEKPARRGPAISLEFFDAQGALISQIFGHRTAEVDHNAAWSALVEEEVARLSQEEPA
ncbi:hemin-degrading factor [Oceanicola sp. S124]|uniref:hemin-degrading factor n=1 Tax=Oceanicola sp. S124 TaxID=1042378 RepID=UPI0002558181|nr:hemin-degrading factor [Oceanicola sp. S124]